MKHAISISIISCILAVSASLCRADEKQDHICFSTLDSNKDGMVTFQEFDKHYKNGRDKFNAADIDRDGKLTHDEYHDLLGHGSS